MHYLTAILAGAGAGLWTALLLPLMARHGGGQGAFSSSTGMILMLGGATLSWLMTRLLIWSNPNRGIPTPGAILLPWTGTLILPIIFILPSGEQYAVAGSVLGQSKIAISAAWVLGAFLFATRLLPPLFHEFRPWRLAAGFGAVMLLVSFACSTQPPNESDEGDYVAAALSLIETGTTRLDHIFINKRIHNYYFGHIPSSQSWYDFLITWLPERANRFSYRMIGYPLALAPFLKMGESISTPMIRWWIAHLPGLIGYGLLIGGLSMLLIDRPRQEAGGALLATGCMTPILYFTSNTQPEIWMATGTTWAILLYHRHVKGQTSVVPFAIVTMLLMLLHERMAIISIVLFGMILWRTPERGRCLIIMFVGAVPILISYAATLQFQLPTSAPHAYGIEGTRFFDATRWLEAARQHLFSIRIGLFTHLPPLLLLPLGLRAADFRRTHPRAAIHHLAAAIFTFYFCVMITYPHTFDSFPHLRYMVPVLPALGILLMPALERIQRYRWGAPVIFILIGLQIARAWPFLAVPQLWRRIV